MYHTELESQILLEMAAERISRKGPVEGLRRRPHSLKKRAQRLMELSGNTLILAGSWLKARGVQPSQSTSTGTLPGPIMEAGLR